MRILIIVVSLLVLAGSLAEARPRRRVAKCRSIFCTSQVISMGSDGKSGGLTYKEVQKAMRKVEAKLLPCALNERRRNPRLREARIEFVVSRRGRVLATRVNGKRRSSLSRCIHRKLRPLVRFQKLRAPTRQVASFSLMVVE